MHDVHNRFVKYKQRLVDAVYCASDSTFIAIDARRCCAWGTLRPCWAHGWAVQPITWPSGAIGSSPTAWRRCEALGLAVERVRRSWKSPIYAGEVTCQAALNVLFCAAAPEIEAFEDDVSKVFYGQEMGRSATFWCVLASFSSSSRAVWMTGTAGEGCAHRADRASVAGKAPGHATGRWAQAVGVQ